MSISSILGVALQSGYMQLFTEKGADLRAKSISMGFLADRDRCHAWQGCRTARKKMTSAGYPVYPDSHCSEEEGKEKKMRGDRTAVQGRDIEEVERNT